MAPVTKSKFARQIPWKPKFVKYTLKQLQDLQPRQGNRIVLSAKFDKRHQNWIDRHWEYIRWQRMNHVPKQTQLNKFAISHGFIYFHPLLYEGYFSKNKNLTKLVTPFKKPKRKFRQKHETCYQEQR